MGQLSGWTRLALVPTEPISLKTALIRIRLKESRHGKAFQPCAKPAIVKSSSLCRYEDASALSVLDRPDLVSGPGDCCRGPVKDIEVMGLTFILRRQCRGCLWSAVCRSARRMPSGESSTRIGAQRPIEKTSSLTRSLGVGPYPSAPRAKVSRGQ